MKTLWISIRFLLIFTLLLGVIYPLTMTGLGQVFFKAQVNGSLITEKGKIVGSTLLGQDFSSMDKYFQGRPSVTSPAYNPSASGASNLSPWGEAFKTQAIERFSTWSTKPGANRNSVPQALITASVSGLDPDIPLESALFQVPILGAARQISDLDSLTNLVKSQAKNPLFPWDPSPYVNVLELNRTLDNLYGKP